MKKGITGEKIIVIVLSLIVLVTIFFSIYTIFTNNNYLKNNESTIDLNKNGENQAPSKIDNKNSNTSNNSNNNDATEPTDEEIDSLNVDEDINLKSQKEPEQIATYTTTIYDTDTNRVDNITLANSKLNGHVIKVGEEFSFNNVIGPMDESQGFKKALGFDGEGNKIEISGGGICQISSTLYNAVLIAGLEVTERHPHSHRVYYVPQDKDATIFYGTYDLKFINNTDRDIKIETTNDNANVTINLIKIAEGSYLTSF